MSIGLWMIFRRIGVMLVWLLAGLSFQAGAAAQSDGMGEPAVAMGGKGVQGTVTAVAADRLTLKTERGELYQVAISPNTRVLRNRESIKLSEIRPGDGIGAMGELDAPNKTMHALYLVVIDAEQIKKAREALGKTWITGTVTAIDDTRITVLRPDQVRQVISVDEDTSFRRGGHSFQMGLGGGSGAGGSARNGTAASQDAGESVTLLDVKVGSLVAGPGSLKKGVFVPTTLGISDASVRGRRQNGAGNAPSAPAAGGELKGR